MSKKTLLKTTKILSGNNRKSFKDVLLSFVNHQTTCSYIVILEHSYNSNETIALNI